MRLQLVIILLILASACIQQHSVEITEKNIYTIPKPTAGKATSSTSLQVTSTTTSSTSSTTSTTIRFKQDERTWLEIGTPEGETVYTPVKVGNLTQIGRLGVQAIGYDLTTKDVQLIAYDLDSRILWNKTSNELKRIDSQGYMYIGIYHSGLRNERDFAIVNNEKYYYLECEKDTYVLAKGRSIYLYLDRDEIQEYLGYSFSYRPQTSAKGDYGVVEKSYRLKTHCIQKELELPSCSVDVPFVRQSKIDWCGPAILNSVFRYYGVSKSQERIRDEILDEKGVTSIRRMMQYLGENGLSYEFYLEDGAKIDILKDRVCKKHQPVIVLQRFRGADDNQLGHYRLILGFDNTYVYLQDPYRGRFRVTYSQFRKLSKANQATSYDNQAIVVKRR